MLRPMRGERETLCIGAVMDEEELGMCRIRREVSKVCKLWLGLSASHQASPGLRRGGRG